MGLDERIIYGSKLQLTLHEDPTNGASGTPRESAANAVDLVAATRVAALESETRVAGRGGIAALAATHP